MINVLKITNNWKENGVLEGFGNFCGGIWKDDSCNIRCIDASSVQSSVAKSIT